MTGLPSRSRPSATGRVAREFVPLRRLEQLAERHHPRRRVGDLDPDRAPARNRRHPDRLGPHGDGQVVGQRAIRPTFTPGAGTTSNWVTTGPVVRPAIVPSTLKVRRVSSSTWPSRSSSASPASMSRARRRQQIDRRQLVSSSSSGAGPRGLSVWRSCSPCPPSSDPAAKSESPPGRRSSSSVRRERSRGAGVAGAGGSRAPAGAGAAPSSRCSGCHAIVSRVSAERARKPSSRAPANPIDVVGRRARNPGSQSGQPGAERHGRLRQAPGRLGVTRVSDADDERGDQQLSPPSRIATASCRGRAARSKPARAMPNPRSGMPRAPIPSLCQRMPPSAAPSGPVAATGSRVSPAKRPKTRAATAPSRRRASSVTPRGRGHGGDPPVLVHRKHGVGVLAGRVDHVRADAQAARSRPASAGAERPFPVDAVAAHEIERGERRVVHPRGAGCRRGPPAPVGRRRRHRRGRTAVPGRRRRSAGRRRARGAPCAAAPAIERLTAAARKTLAAPCVASSARVPLVVVITRVRPRTASAVISRGLLPRANPGIGRPPALAAEDDVVAAEGLGEAHAPRRSRGAGRTARAPWCSAAQTTVEARRMSITKTVRPAACPGWRPSGEKTTSSFMPRISAAAARARGTWCPPCRPTKSGWRMTRARNGIVVVTPSRMKLSRAWPMRCSASCAVVAVHDDLGEQRVVVRRHGVPGVDVACPPGRPGRPADGTRVIEPGQGWKFRYGILGVDPALDRVPAEVAAVALEADPLARRRPGSAPSPGRSRSPSR